MNDLYSALFYIGSFCASAYLLNLGIRRNNKQAIFFSLIIPVLIATFRFDVGTDFDAYVSIFEKFRMTSIGEFISDSSNGTEIGFYIINKVSDYFTHSPTFMFFSMSAINVVFVYFSIKKYKFEYKTLVWLLYLLTIFPSSLNIVRQAAAMSIMLYAFSSIIEGKLIKYICFTVMAAMLHTSALLLLPVYILRTTIINKSKNNIKFMIFAAVMSFAIIAIVPIMFNFITHDSIFSRYDMYNESAGSSAGLQVYLQLFFIIVFGCVLMVASRDSAYRMFYLFQLINVSLLMCADSSQITKRMAFYFSFSQIALLAILPTYIKSGVSRKTIIFFEIVYAILIFLVSYVLLKQAEVIPYRFSI